MAWDGTTAIPLTSFVNQPGWSLDQATGINDAGQIVGNGTVNGVTHAFLLTPVPAPATSLVLGMTLLAASRRRRTSRDGGSWGW